MPLSEKKITQQNAEDHPSSLDGYDGADQSYPRGHHLGQDGYGSQEGEEK
jgi:hypothetical protein